MRDLNWFLRSFLSEESRQRAVEIAAITTTPFLILVLWLTRTELCPSNRKDVSLQRLLSGAQNLYLHWNFHLLSHSFSLLSLSGLMDICRKFEELNIWQYKLLYTISNNIEVYEDPVTRTKKISHCALKFGAKFEENRIVNKSLQYTLLNNCSVLVIYISPTQIQLSSGTAWQLISFATYFLSSCGKPFYCVSRAHLIV